MMMSLDGYFEGPGHDLSWHNVDTEFNDFAINQLHEVDTLLFGRKTYDMMASYWPAEAAIADDPVVAKLMNDTPKVAFSHDELKAAWQNTQVSDDAVAKVQKLKTEPGKDIAIFGSNNLCVSLMGGSLVDEFRLMVNPIAIGKGTALFTGLANKLAFKHIGTWEFKNGNILLTYQPA